MARRIQFAKVGPVFYWGQSLTEYSLIALCVILIAVPALTMFSGGIKVSFMNLLDAPPSQSYGHSAPSGGGAIPDVSGLGLGLSKATGMTLPTSTPSELQQTVQTAGVNGATQLLADGITKVAQQKLAAGEIDQAQYNALINLANEGHRQAAILGAIENAFLNNNGQEPYDTIVQIDGKPVSIITLANRIGFDDSPSSVPTDPLDPSHTGCGDLKKFLDAYQSALNSGALNDPAIKQQIDGLASQIAAASSAVDIALYDYDDNKIRPEAITSQTASKLTNQNSVAICQTSNGTDSGQSCQP